MKKLEILQRYYGYNNLKIEQEQIINSILTGNDTIGILPTGFGKSVTFQIPALIYENITLVITPLIALMHDQVTNLKSKGIKAEYINSTQDAYIQDNVYNRILLNKVKILYVSAERLLSNKFLHIINQVKIDMLVCDEAHTLMWSDDFRIALSKIPLFITKLGYKIPILALTATATSHTIKRIKELLNLDNPNIIIGNCDRKNIFYRIVKSENKLNDLLKYILLFKNRKGLVYCLTIRNCKYIYNYLVNMNFKVGLYHGCLESKEKEIVLNRYYDNEIDIIVCTNAFGMGIDIPDIRYVIEYDMPISIEDFTQQIGRASRDNEYAEAILLFNVNDIKMANYFIDNIKNEEKTDKELNTIKKNKYIQLDKMINLALTRDCIHKYICNYFNQNHNGNCKMCSNCKKK